MKKLLLLLLGGLILNIVIYCQDKTVKKKPPITNGSSGGISWEIIDSPSLDKIKSKIDARGNYKVTAIHELIKQPLFPEVNKIPPKMQKRTQETLQQSHFDTILVEGFEGAFPSGLWNVLDGDGATNGEYYWAKRSYRKHLGNYSVWCVGGGANGSSLSSGSNYPPNASSHMIYGPFDLSGSNWGTLTFYVWFNTETDYDQFTVTASINGRDFKGYAYSGSSGNSWSVSTFSFLDVPDLGNISGSSTVWIKFGFYSDASTQYEGVYIDDIMLRRGKVEILPIVSQFASPSSDPRGLAYDGTNLWCADITSEKIYKLNLTGSILSSFSSPGTGPTGLTWDGIYLWNSDITTDRIYKLTTTGSVVSYFSSPGQTPEDLTWDGSSLWLCDYGVSTIWKLNTSGSILSSFTAPGISHYGLTRDDQSLWLSDVDEILIYRMDATGKVLEYYLPPGLFPSGLEWDGSYLWVADAGNDLIYKLQVTTQTPKITLNTNSLTFTAVQNGSLPSNQYFNISNGGGGTLNWSISDDANWLDVTPTSGTNNGTIKASINTTNLSIGNYNATITITGTGASNTPQSISVTYTVTSNLPTVTTGSASSITSSSAVLTGSVNPNGLTTNVWFEYGTTISYGTSIQASPNTITGNTSANVTANVSNLNPGTLYHFRIKAENSSGTSYGDDKTFTTLRLPSIALSTTNITFNVDQYGTIPSNQQVTINNGGDETLNWTISDDATWLDVSPSNGTNSGTITVSINTTNLTTLNNTAKITVTATGASNSPQVINVIYNLTVYPTSISVNTSTTFPTYSNPRDYKVTDWKLFGLPGESNLSLNVILTGSHKTDWDAYWDNGGTDYVQFSSGSADFKFTLGKAFWVISKGSLNVNRSINSAIVNTLGQAEILLHNNWNIITNPFPKSISWSKVQSLNNISEPLWGYNGSWSNPISFDPYVGYFFHNKNNLTVLKIPYDAASTSLSKTEMSDPAKWRVGIEYINGGYVDNVASFGVSEIAKKGIDGMDYLKPKPIGEISEVYFPKSDDKMKKYATDFRPDFENSQMWEFEITSIEKVESQLKFSGIKNIPADYDVYLLDNTNSKIINLRQDSIYRFTPITKIRKFCVTIGKGIDIEEKMRSLLPNEFVLCMNYPNPFNPSTIIPVKIPYTSNVQLLIYNVLGKEVKVLYNGILNSGVTMFEWNGKDEKGNSVSSGVYYYFLRAEKFRDIKKMMYVR